MEIKWNATSKKLPDEGSDDNYAFLTESKVLGHGYFEGGIFIDPHLRKKYPIEDIVYWILEFKLHPKGFDKELERRIYHSV